MTVVHTILFSEILYIVVIKEFAYRVRSVPDQDMMYALPPKTKFPTEHTIKDNREICDWCQIYVLGFIVR